MRTFSIKELEMFSEIKSHTLRIWEKRYSVFNPGRTQGNVRQYSVSDLQHLLNIALLKKLGYRISHLASMKECAMEANISSLNSNLAQQLNVLNRMIVCMFSRHTDGFEATLDKSVRDFGIDATIEIIVLFLEKVDLLAYNDTSCEVHFVVTAVRRKIIYGIETIPSPQGHNKSALLFLPRAEHYDLILLYFNYILKKKGFRVYYLGTNISLENVQQVAIEKRPDYLVTYNTPQHSFKINDFMKVLAVDLPQTSLFISGYPDPGYEDQENVSYAPYYEMEKHLTG